ncbi:MAG: class I SAM-dependent methyltransferase [Polyangiaceae bacterium]|nr:class I SAM-dependent methyltransferase [Polyangiaceae bacterium]
MTTQGDARGYVLGHSPEELQRLEHQGAFLRGATRAVLRSAGLQQGMRVLDFGCGVGDVSLLAREIVGPTGEVIGIDRSAQAVELASARAAAQGLTNVRFAECEEPGVEAVAGGRPFDAVVGRLVLIHQRDPVATVRHLTSFVRPGGVVAFHEIDLAGGHWVTHENPLLGQLWRWIGGLTERGVFPRSLGTHLHEALEHAGLQDRAVTREGRIVRNSDRGANAWVAGFARSIAEPVQKLGVHHESDQPIDVLLERLHAAEGFCVPVYMVGAHGTVPMAP